MTELRREENRYSEPPGSNFVDTRRFSLRQSQVEEEIPLKSGNPRVGEFAVDDDDLEP